MPTNPYQLKTPEDASQYSQAAMESGMQATAQANPGVVVLGGQVGNTAGGIPSTPLMQELYMAPTEKQKQAENEAWLAKMGLSPAAEEAVKADSAGTLTSAPADQYLKNIQAEAAEAARTQKEYATSGQVYEDLKSTDPAVRLQAERALGEQKQADIARMQKEQEGAVISPSAKEAYIRQLPALTGEESQLEKDLRKIVMAGGWAGLSAGQALTNLTRATEERIAATRATKELTTAQKETMATEKVGQYRMGQAGGSYADAYTAKKEEERALQREDLSKAIQKQMDESWNAALTGNLAMAERFRNEAQLTFDQRMKVEQLAQQENAQMMQMRQYEDTRSANAQTAAMNTIGNLVTAGYTADQLPKEYLDAIDANAGMPYGFSARLFEASQAEQEAQKIMDAAAAQKADMDNVKSIFSMLKEVPAGQQIDIAGNTYFGTQGTGTVEVSKDDGHGRLAYVDQSTGEIKVKDLGLMGDIKSGNWETVFVNGVQMSHNKDTNAYVPFVTSQGASGDANWGETFCPDGSVGGQCGEFIHNFVEDYPYGINTVEQREAIVNVDKTEMPRVGDVLLQNYGTTGHSAMVNFVFQGADGKTMVKLTESNFHGDGKVQNTRSVSMDDPSVLGLFRGQLRPHAQTGSDLMPAVAGPVRPGEEFKPMTAETAATEGGFIIPPGGLETFSGTSSEYNKAKQDEQEAINSAQMLISGDMTKAEVPATIKVRAMQIATANGWTGSIAGTLSEKDRKLAARIANYDVDVTKIISLRSDQRQKFVEAAMEINPNFSSADAPARASLKKELASGGLANNIRALNTATGHLSDLKDAADALSNRWLPLWNKLANWASAGIGNPAVTNFNQKRLAVASELAKVFKGTGVTGEQEIKEWQDAINSSMSPEQLKGSIEGAIHLMGSRIDAIKDQYRSVMGEDMPNEIMSPKSIETMKRIDPLFAEEYASPTGDSFSIVAPDGNTYAFGSQSELDTFKRQAGL